MITVPSTTTTTSNHINVSYNTKIGFDHTTTNASNPIRVVAPNNPTPPINPMNPSSFANISSHLFSSSTSSSTASDDEFAKRSKRKRKRKWKQFFKRLTREVMDKQEELQMKFLETIEKREHERLVREEAWRVQEIARINREHEVLIQERSTATAKDAAVISFLQKVSGQQQQQQQQQQLSFGCVEMGNASLGRDTITIQRQGVTQKPPPSLPPPQPLPHLQPLPQPLAVVNLDGVNNGDKVVVSSSSRWPKAEVLALIRLRTNLDIKYQENTPKGPLWEEISAAMRKLGYNRNAKRCKEKWENINKYFKKVKESTKQRPEDSKTCPYFHQLDALYKEKNNKINNSNNNGVNNKPPIDTLMEPLMVQPEQQWPPPQQGQGNNNHLQTVIMEDMEKENLEGEDSHEDEEEEEEEEEEEDDEGGGVYEIVANNNKPVSVATTHE